MKNSSLKGKTDPELHVRKKMAGGATGAVLGAVVAGPIGAIVGGAVGTLIGRAAEQGRSLEMPKRMSKRTGGTKVKARAPSKAAAKGSGGSAGAKKSAAPRSKRTATAKKIGSKK